MRIKYICIIGFILISGMKSWGIQIQTDTLTRDSTEKKISRFHRLYRNIYRYFMESNQEKEEKKFDFSIIGGPHYSSDVKLGVGLVASGLYRVDPADKSIPPSNVSFYGDITTTGYYLIGIRNNTILHHDNYRLNLNFYFFSFPSLYWGIGYENARQDDHYTEYKRKEKQIRLDFSRRILHNTYFGISALFRHVNAKDMKDPSFLNGEKPDIATLGFGLFLTYDSRDFIPNPFRGTYAQIEHSTFPAFLSNKDEFKRTEIDIRHYERLWKGAVLASVLQGTFNYGDTPWSMVALLGGSYQMRGYYEGRYRDNDLLQAQIELRQHIYNRHGIALWVGAGNVFPKFDKFKWKQTLPSYGIGYRWEFKKRVNVRLDYGIGKGEHSFYFNIDEAF